jgi:RNA polymerase sigma-70 factor (ECF subfamily)
LGQLGDCYLAHRDPPAGSAGPDKRKLEATLGRLVAEARAAWPSVDLPAPVFVRHLAERVGDAPLANVRAADLYLACACANGLGAALEALETRYLSKMGAYLSRLEGRPEIIDEVQQVLRERLLVGAPGRPGRIADYQGRSALETWLRAAAARAAMNLGRDERRRGRAAAAAAGEAVLEIASPDPELEYVKAQYRPELEASLRSALAALPARDRTLLRLHYLERVGAGVIATSYGVHRSTVNRWLSDAQQVLLADTRRLLRERLRLSPTECESVVGALRSRLDLTLGSLLRTRPPER